MPPGDPLAVEGAVSKAAVEDPDQTVRQGAQGGVVIVAPCDERVVVGPGTGGGGEGAEGPQVARVPHVAVADVAGPDNLALAEGKGNGGREGEVLGGLGM